MYNLYNFEATFRQYLQDKNAKPATIKNYISDYRHFWGWFLMTLKQQCAEISEHDSKLLTYLTTQKLQQYKKFLIINNVPSKTINRRLSSIRAFVHHCLLNQWITKSITKSLTNVPIAQKKKEAPKKEQQSDNSTQELVDAFACYLKTTKVTALTARNYIGDVRQFLAWMDGKK